MKLEEIKDSLEKVYASSLAEIEPELEEDLFIFEKQHQIAIPSEYRKLLKEYGAFNFGQEPFIYTLKELSKEYPNFLDTYKEYQEGYDMPENLCPFPIGFFGEGSVAIIDRYTEKVFILLHDAYEDVPLEEIAVDFVSLLKFGMDNMYEWLEKINS
ncbi:SMI1/KNR4 family protein [Sporosarcina sp. FSL K6-1522]|uniref:SMI1/KNR4 family protein n=1 Tax=Sporosarcina sp. FSL K6-1522 TaxID=2921554 RepID=UPI00315AD814